LRNTARNIIGLTIFLVLALLGSSCKPELKSDLPIVQLSIDGNNILVEVANTESTRMAGLMFRNELGTDNGMLFVFSDDASRAFWMKNTLIPLSIAFMDEKGVIENTLEMPPQTEQTFMSAGPAKYALEMNAGWYTKHAIKQGDVVVGATTAPSSKD
jgi:uncharacterized membrane protein (UPF0127 family)